MEKEIEFHPQKKKLRENLVWNIIYTKVGEFRV